MDRRVRITESTLKRTLLKAAGPGQRISFSDVDLRGFSVRVDGPTPTRPGSLASFYASGRVDGKQIRRFCGVYGDASRDSRLVSVATGRSRADKYLAEMRLGVDTRPRQVAAVDRSPDLFEDVVARYLDHLERMPKKDGSIRAAGYISATRSYYDRLPWRGRDIASISKADVRAVLEGFERADKLTASRRLLSALKALFSWCVRKDLVSISPVAGIVAESGETQRDRTLSDAELKIVWQACVGLGSHLEAFVKVLALSGQRRGEVAGLRYADIVDGTWTLTAERNKAGRVHLVPMSPSVLRLIDELPRVGSGVYVFGRRAPVGFSDIKLRLDRLTDEAADKLGLPRLKPWHFHDLRRTCATGMSSLKVPRFTVERVLNHADGSVTGRYDRHDYFDEKRAALEAWSRHIQSLTGGNIVDLKPAAKAKAKAKEPVVA